MPITTYTPRWRDLLNRVFVGKRQGISDITVLDDVFPTFSLTDETQGEYHLSRGELLWGAGHTQAASVGNYTKFQFRNLSADKITVLESIRISGCSLASVWHILTVGSVIGGFTAAAINRTDLRGTSAGGGGGIRESSDAVMEYLQDAVGPTYTIAGQVYIPATSGPVEMLTEDMIIPPGKAVWVYGVTVNLGATIQATGYTRFTEPTDV